MYQIHGGINSTAGHHQEKQLTIHRNRSKRKASFGNSRHSMKLWASCGMDFIAMIFDITTKITRDFPSVDMVRLEERLWPYDIAQVNITVGQLKFAILLLGNNVSGTNGCDPHSETLVFAFVWPYKDSALGSSFRRFSPATDFIEFRGSNCWEATGSGVFWRQHEIFARSR